MCIRRYHQVYGTLPLLLAKVILGRVLAVSSEQGFHLKWLRPTCIICICFHIYFPHIVVVLQLITIKFLQWQCLFPYRTVSVKQSFSHFFGMEVWTLYRYACTVGTLHLCHITNRFPFLINFDFGVDFLVVFNCSNYFK